MPEPLKVLFVEDNADDTELLLAELRRFGYTTTWTRVETERDFLAELANAPDIVLSDYSMPQFNGIRAATVLRESGLDIPFILVSGTVGEDVAVDAMRHGATDYLLKDRTGRLGSAVERALREARTLRDHKQAEAALAATQAQLQKTLEHSPVVIYSLKISGEVITPLTVNENVVAMLGYSVEEALDASWWHAHLHPDDAEQVALLSGNMQEDVVSLEYRFAHRIGHYLWLEDRRRILRDHNGAPIEISGVWIDINARKESERALELLHRSHALILDSVDEGIQGIDQNGRITFENIASAKMFGRTAHEAVGANAHALVHHSHSDHSRFSPAECRINATLADGISRRVDDEVFWRKDGTSFPVEYVVAPKRDENGAITGAVVVFHNIAERRSLEAQFRQSQKLESIGQLAGGIAHDFNNILSIMMMQAELALTVPDTAEEVQQALQEIRIAADRAANLTRQLLLFSRKQVMQPTLLDVNAVVTDLSKMLTRIVPEDVTLQVSLHPAPLVTYADAGMLDQVLMNLTVNARDAMSEGGELQIVTSVRDVTTEEAQMHAEATAGRYVGLAVRDTGHGISPEIRAKMFEPFFTTKGAGKGTGLGLATVFGVVKQHRGWIEVDSEIDKGTTISIYLAASEEKPAPADGDTFSAKYATRSGAETILVAEDDSTVRTLTRMVLKHQGYTVLEAANGIEALRIWEQHSDEISLLLTDMVMPGGMNGRELAARLRGDDPQLRIVFSSGYSADIAGRELQLDRHQRFVQKPCSAQRLLETVRSALDEL